MGLRFFPLRKTLLFTLLASGALFLKYQPWVKLKGLSLSEEGLKVDKVEIDLQPLKLKVFNLSLNLKEIKVSSVGLKLYLPPQEGVYIFEPLRGRDIADYISLGLEVAKALPLRVNIKDLYLDIEPLGLNLNLYNLSKVGKEISLNYGELFLPSLSDSVAFSSLSLSLFKNYLLLGGKVRFFDQKAVISLDGNLQKRLNLWVDLGEEGKVKGWLRFCRAVVFDLKGSYKGISLSIDGFYDFLRFWSQYRFGRKDLFSLKGKVDYNFLYEKLKTEGNLKLCKRELLYSFYSDQRVDSLLLQSLDPPLYIITSNGKGGGYIGRGSFRLKNNLLVLKNFSLENFCGLSVSDLSLLGKLEGETLTLKGSFEKLKLQKEASFEIFAQEFSLFKDPFGIKLALKRSLKGEIFANRRSFKGELKGVLSLNGKRIRLNLKGKGDLLSQRAKLKVNHLSVEKLLSLSDTKATLNYQKGIKASFSGNWKGELSLKNSSFGANLKGKLTLLERRVHFSLKGRGDLKGGKVVLKSPSGRASLGYKREGQTYRGRLSIKTPLGGIKSDFDLKYPYFEARNFLTLKGKEFDLSLFATLLARGNLETKRVRIYALPFCVNFLNQKLACFEKFEAKTEGGAQFRLTLKGIKGLPLYTYTRLELKKELLKLKGEVSLSKLFLNYWLLGLGSYIESPRFLTLKFFYRGKPNRFKERFTFFYSQHMDLVSRYFYKPISAYITATYVGGSLDLMVGLADRDTQNLYGTASFSYNFLTERGKGKFDFASLPFRFYMENFLSAYAKVYASGEASLGKENYLKSSLGVGGFVNLYSYKPPSLPKGGEKKKGKTLPLKLDISLNSVEPIYVRFPNGEAILTFTGKVKNGEKKLKVVINHGKLNILGKRFVINGSHIKIEKNKTYIDLHLVHYAVDRTIFLHIYGFLPWQNLKVDIYSVPPAPKEQLLAYLVGGGAKGQGEGFASSLLGNFPLASVILQGAYMGVGALLNKLSGMLIGGVKVDISPNFDPNRGLTFGVRIEKDFGDLASLGYNWQPSTNPKDTYFWGSTRFLYDSFLRFTRYSDGSTALTLRLLKEFGSPF